MTTRRDFLQYLGISGLVAAVHNVDALGITVLEKKLILPNKLWDKWKGCKEIIKLIPGT